MTRLEQLEVIGYRSFRSATVAMGNALVIIGENDVGKSNFVSALSVFYEPEKALPEPGDHFGFDPLSTVTIRGTLRRGASESLAVPGLEGDGQPDVLILEREWRGQAELVSSIILPDGSRISSKKSVAVLDGSLPRLVTAPPLRDFRQELKIGPRAAFGKTLVPIVDTVRSAVREQSEQLEAKFAEALQVKLDDLTAITRELNPRIERVVGHPRLDLAAGLDVEIDIEDSSGLIPIERKGSGVKSSIVLALFRYYAKEAGLTEYTYAVEEPEAYLYPHLQRQLFAALRDLSGKGNQIIVTSHSPYFIDDLPVQELRDSVVVGRYSRDAGTRLFRPVPGLLEPADLNWIQSNVTSKNSEMLFARCVLLVEGPTERFAFPILAERIGMRCNVRGISIVEVGGNHFEPFVKLLRAYEIPTVVFCDNNAAGNLDACIASGWLSREDLFVNPGAGFEDLYPPEVKAATAGLSKPAAGRKAAQLLPDVPHVVAEAIRRADERVQP